MTSNDVELMVGVQSELIRSYTEELRGQFLVCP